MDRQKALKLASEVDEIYAAKGSKVVHLNLKNDEHNDDEIAGLLLGPTGNLRAPAIRVGRKLIVGFNEDAYKELIK